MWLLPYLILVFTELIISNHTIYGLLTLFMITNRLQLHSYSGNLPNSKIILFRGDQNIYTKLLLGLCYFCPTSLCHYYFVWKNNYTVYLYERNFLCFTVFTVPYRPYELCVWYRSQLVIIIFLCTISQERKVHNFTHTLFTKTHIHIHKHTQFNWYSLLFLYFKINLVLYHEIYSVLVTKKVQEIWIIIQFLLS